MLIAWGCTRRVASVQADCRQRIAELTVRANCLLRGMYNHISFPSHGLKGLAGCTRHPLVRLAPEKCTLADAEPEGEAAAASDTAAGLLLRDAERAGLAALSGDDAAAGLAEADLLTALASAQHPCQQGLLLAAGD